jgi:hypothetical protein
MKMPICIQVGLVSKMAFKDKNMYPKPANCYIIFGKIYIIHIFLNVPGLSQFDILKKMNNHAASSEVFVVRGCLKSLISRIAAWY